MANFASSAQNQDARRRGAYARLCVLGFALALGGCHPQSTTFSGAQFQPGPPPPSDANAAPYKLQVGDQLDIKFLPNPELDISPTVQPDGYITLPFADHDVLAAGHSVRDVQNAVIGDYSALLQPGTLNERTVAIDLRVALPDRFYVGGQVNAPGEYLVNGPPLDLVQAIVRGGGVNNQADTSQVILIRRGPDGTPRFYSVNYSDAVSGKTPGADFTLQPYDVVYVPRTVIGDVYAFYQQAFQQFIPASFGFTDNVKLLNGASVTTR